MSTNKKTGQTTKEKANAGKSLQDHLESLADYITAEYKDDVEMIYASRKGLLRDLRRNIALLETVLTREDRTRMRNCVPVLQRLPVGETGKWMPSA